MKNDKMISLIVNDWFKDHIAILDGQRLIWKRPQSGMYKIVFVIDQGTLLVWGDVGEAVYRWGSDITWEFLADCDLDYFVEKCCASEVGRDFKRWSGEHLADELKHWLRERYPEQSEDGFEPLILAASETSRPEDWRAVAEERRNRRVLGGAIYEMGDWGYVVHPRAIGHWVGIKMAMKNDKFTQKYINHKKTNEN